MLKAIQESSPGVLVIRILVAAVVVFGSYNPTGKSVFHWVSNHPDPTNAWVILGAIVAILLNVALLIAAWNALGFVGTIIVLILFGALAYLSFQEGWVGTDKRDTIQWLALSMYSIFLGIGLAGAILWRRATGQVVVEDSDDS